MITVVAALIQRDGKLLICQRRESDSFGLKWEFPGGKVRAGEPPEVALERELEEELAVRATVGCELYRTRYRYAESRDDLELIFFEAEIAAQSVQNRVFEAILWSEPSELPRHDFLPADREFVDLLSRGALRLRG